MSLNWSNITTVNDLLASANTNTGGYFWVAMLYAFIIIVLLSLINFSFEVALFVSLFAGIVAGIMLVGLGLIGMMWLGILIGILVIAIIFFIASANRNQ